MEGVMELAEEVFHMPVRLGLPQNVSGLADVVRNPIYSTGVGLLLYGHQQRFARKPALRAANGEKGVWGRMKGWFQGNF
jgi:cell division protein FtsA